MTELSASATRSYMLAVDDSPNSLYAFEEVSRMMNHERDLLYLITVAEFIPFYGPAITAMVITEAQKSCDIRAESLLAEYAQRCRLAGIKNLKSLLGRGGHVGEVICRATEEKAVDMLFIGRRGMGKIKRLFIGSTSRYCVEHANCTVVCVKLPANHVPTPLPSTVSYQAAAIHKAEAQEHAKRAGHGALGDHELFTLRED